MTASPVGHDGERVWLADPLSMPRASAFLWNSRMMLQADCRGFAVAQHLQPEPARYSHAPNLEARSFMQPEQPRYAHHSGRFVYVKDEASGAHFSVPHEPVRRPPEGFRFSVGPGDLHWEVRSMGLQLSWSVSLPVEDAAELWTLRVRNAGGDTRALSLYPFFTIGYMSWMNQSAGYRPDLGGVVARSVTPYQKVEDYERIKACKDLTCLLHGAQPTAWEARLEAFEGEGGLPSPDALLDERLGNGDALYEMPAAVLQYRVSLAPGAAVEYRFVFGPARDDAEIADLRDRYLCAGGFERAQAAYRAYLEAGRGCLRITTPDAGLDGFVNHWLGRQVYYHGELNRLSTDPQTRNYLQDAMGLAYVQAAAARRAFLHALAQQQAGGAMPDGILLHEQAELKYINQVPHSDHCVWLPVCLQAYLDETGDYGLLDEPVASTTGDSAASVFERVTRALHWLVGSRDSRGLSYIAQGDWCDPMNMVGHRGRGVSGWLSIATVHALRCWADVCVGMARQDEARDLLRQADEIAAAVQRHLWDGDWFARGITDDGVPFGVAADGEGRIFLNPQSWAMLAGIAGEEQAERMLRAIAEQLEGPHGVALLSPPYTKMREDVGRLTQKFPGSAENGSVYNHAVAFYIYALYAAGRADHAYRLLRRMIPGPAAQDFVQRGQLPVFIPNYYRGAWREFPRTAGRSSQLVNTGTASWFYRCLVEGLFGVRGCRQGLRIEPRLPGDWGEASITREFRGAHFHIRMRRVPGPESMQIVVDGVPVAGSVIGDVEAGRSYQVEVRLGGADA
jgi:cellobionic acid phosphorylase